ncbi:MAG: thioredoxin [Peptococcaceae bacterium BICA1-8]|nr:MAG: thioredoxin [Peptococcaceae bacterium BICA1-8]
MAIQKVDSNQLDEAIFKNNEACVVVFSREGCHVCQEVVPRVEEISKEYEGKLSFYYVDVEEEKDLFKKFSLKGVPQLLFFKDGEFHGKLAGDVEEDDIEEKIDCLI